MRPLVNSSIASLKPYVPGKPVEEVKRELGLDDVLKLASNENPLGPSPKALEAMTGALGSAHIYPDGAAFALKEAIATYIGVSPTELATGNGSNELLTLLARTFCLPGDHAVISDTSFIAYRVIMSAESMQWTSVPTLGGEAFETDVDAMLAAIKPGVTRMVFVANPNNPTGTYLPRTKLSQLLAQAPPEVIVVVDEAYHEYVQAPDYVSALELRHLRERLVVCRTYSKIFGMGGARLGFAVSTPEIMDYLNRVREPFNCNAIAQAAGVAALEGHGLCRPVDPDQRDRQGADGTRAWGPPGPRRAVDPEPDELPAGPHALCRHRPLRRHAHPGRDRPPHGGLRLAKLPAYHDRHPTSVHPMPGRPWARPGAAKEGPVSTTPIIAIDGPAGAGKSTIAQGVARALGFQLIDTGAIYRAVAHIASTRGIDLDDAQATAEVARTLSFEFDLKDTHNQVRCNGDILGDEIRTQAASRGASQVASHPEVRQALLEVQRRLGHARPSVLEGRDVGTVIFPQASLKVFLTAKPEERAKRRLAQLLEQGQTGDYDTILSEIVSRDARDMGRAHAPLKRAKDAVEVDTTALEVDQIVQKIVSLAQDTLSL